MEIAMYRVLLVTIACALLAATASAPVRASEPVNASFDARLATALGADKYGMRNYVLVILKTGPKQMPAGPQRDQMFKGHFANINRLVAAGKLALAGPFDGVDGWRGLFIFAVADIDEARKLVATDPVIINDEMTPEFHKYYGSAALLQVNEIHRRLAKTSF
jgi:uncharacterized protein YciI